MSRTVSVVVLQALGLLAADKGGTSDPFAEIKLLDKHIKSAISGESGCSPLHSLFSSLLIIKINTAAWHSWFL
jgi:hypothetical protein